MVVITHCLVGASMVAELLGNEREASLNRMSLAWNFGTSSGFKGPAKPGSQEAAAKFARLHGSSPEPLIATRKTCTLLFIQIGRGLPPATNQLVGALLHLLFCLRELKGPATLSLALRGGLGAEEKDCCTAKTQQSVCRRLDRSDPSREHTPLAAVRLPPEHLHLEAAPDAF